MRTTRASALLAMLAFVASCTIVPANPVIDSIDPNTVVQSLGGVVKLHGGGFEANVRIDLDDPGASVEVGAFEIRLIQVGAPGLAFAPLHDGPRLLSFVIPPQVVAGTYDLLLVSPHGYEMRVDNAIAVVAEAPPCESDFDCVDADPCTTSERCAEGTCVIGPSDLDEDGDGSISSACGGGDCDDLPAGCGADCFPGNLAADICDGHDQDCDGNTDEDEGTEFFRDADGDFYTGSESSYACSDPDGAGTEWVSVATVVDCNDDSDLAHPGRIESTLAGNCSDLLDNDCDGTADALDPGCAVGLNTPPLAKMSVSPGLGDTSTVFAGSAVGTSDAEQSSASLTYDWDWNGDGAYDAQGLTSMRTFSSPGLYDVGLRVTDTAGARAYRTFAIRVTATNDYIVVSTAVDENDLGATPSIPKGAGFSLREALAFVDVQSIAQPILIPPGMTITIDPVFGGISESSLLEGLFLVGDGATIDGSNLSAAPCLYFNGPSIEVHGLTITNCLAKGLRTNGGLGHRYTRLTLRDNGTGIESLANAPMVGPDNHFLRNTRGLDLGDSANAFNNTFSNNVTGIDIGGFTTLSTVIGNVFHDSGTGVRFSSTQANSIKIWNNTMDRSSGSHIWFASLPTGTNVQNNIFSNAQGAAITGASSAFAALDYNVYYLNSALCSACTPGPNAIMGAPTFINGPASDYRLGAGSVCIDSALPLGLDRNGAAPGLHTGVGPDRGAYESP